MASRRRATADGSGPDRVTVRRILVRDRDERDPIPAVIVSDRANEIAAETVIANVSAIVNAVKNIVHGIKGVAHHTYPLLKESYQRSILKQSAFELLCFIRCQVVVVLLLTRNKAAPFLETCFNILQTHFTLDFFLYVSAKSKPSHHFSF